MKLEDFFKTHPKVAIAFSGGVDSSYLLYAALHYGADVRAYYVKSDFQPEFEMADAMRLVKELNTKITILPVDVLAYADVTSNPSNRCYYCKKVIMSTILNACTAEGYTTLLDGTNASDDEGDRPGMQTLRELQILSPLQICGLTKDKVRSLSQEAGLFTWDKPAYACLATRIPTGDPITKEKLYATEKAEDFLFSLGFRDFRVRRMGDAAKLQFPEAQLDKLLCHREEITKELKKYYSSVLLDMEVRA